MDKIQERRFCVDNVGPDSEWYECFQQPIELEKQTKPREEEDTYKRLQ